MQPPKPPIVIKKYSNRRLYDTAESRYVTLEELAEKIQRGTEIRVIDAKTETDLTQLTLTQIILESRGAGKLLPVPLLFQLIRMGDDTLAEFLGRYIAWSLDMYVQAKAGAQAVAPYNPFAMAPFAATQAFARMYGSSAPNWPDGANGTPNPNVNSNSNTNAKPAAAAPPPPPPPSSDDVAELRRELDALKKSLRRKTK